MSGLVNKVKDALHSDKSSSTTTSQPEGTHGPHNSRAGNTVDPRVDSDRDHRATHTTHTTAPTHTTGTHTTGTHTTGTHTTGLHEPSYATSGTHEPGYNAGGLHEGAYSVGSNNRGLSGPASRTDGPHANNLMNKADPRVDSDRDYSRNMGANTERSADTGRHQQSTLGSSTGTTSHTTATYGAPEGTYGPHSSRAMNTADPRIDSDRDHRGTTTGTHTTGTHTTGSHAFGSTNATGHSTRTTGGLENISSTGPGPAPNTAGPHKSDMMNKADPRVDSDLDGSKTVGGNKTYAQ